MPEAIDPTLLNDFLTESAELLEHLDADLVALERLAGQSDRSAMAELLNGIFRAVHTIKGAAGFLNLGTLTHFTHAAEDALNRLRKGEVQVTAGVMDALLQSVDVIRAMVQQVSAGQEATPGPDDLVRRLREIVQGAAAPPAVARQAAPANAPGADSSATVGRLMSLPPEKADLLEFMVADLREQAKHLGQLVTEAASPANRAEVAAAMALTAGEVQRTAEFFNLADLTRLAGTFAAAAPALDAAEPSVLPHFLARLAGACHLIDLQAQALERKLELNWPLDTFIARLTALASGQSLDPASARSVAGDEVGVLVVDGVLPGGGDAAVALMPTVTPQHQETSSAIGPAASTTPVTDTPTTTKSGPETRSSNTTPAAGEQTVRVEVGRLEALLNLVGQMVLTKNRMQAVCRQVCKHDLPADLTEHLTMTVGDLDRLTSDLQVGVMRTRMQPLAKLFDRYPRMVRDLARMTGKKIDLQLAGKETEVDKSVLELLGDPLVHILRNSGDHGIETPEVRRSAGKNETGVIRVSAEHQGSHVRVEITDDGKGLDRRVLGAKAVEKGLATAEQVAAMSDAEVHHFIFAPGFSTAEKVTDLSGRGVGMDVVRTNVARLNGTINIYSTVGAGTTIEILIPLTVAIMPAMVVGVGDQLYCVPLQSILEIVRLSDANVPGIGGEPVLRLRESVLPLVDLRTRLTQGSAQGVARFAVVVGVGRQRAGLMVDRLIGRQEIVIKSLDDRAVAGGPFSGATIRDDGTVSLILDVIQLVRQPGAGRRAAA